MHTQYLVLIIFVLSFVVINFPKISFLRIDRASGVTVGAVLLVITGVLSLEETYQLIDWNVITFLLGMMILIAYLEFANFFEFIASWLVRISNSANQLLIYTLLSSAILSAAFVNDTICLLLTPIILKATKHLKLNPIPFLIAIATASNIGSALTITGNPQNMYIGIQAKLNFLHFSLNMFTPCCFAMIVNYLIIRFIFRRDFKHEFIKNVEIKIPNLKTTLTVKTLFAFCITFVLFIIGFSYPLAALIGAAFIIIFAYVPPHYVFKKIDWTLLLFFAGLFVLMGAFQKSAILNKVLELANPYLTLNNLGGFLGFSAITTILSNLISNVPAVILLKPFIIHIGPTPALWTLLAMVSNFAGNFILVGSVANLIVAEKASYQGVELDFVSYLKVGIPVSLISIIFGTFYFFLMWKLSA